jgi:hypothetical protein
MYQMLRLTIVAMAVVFANFPTSAPARIAVTQIKLTEKHVEAFIAAQKDLSVVVEKMMRGAVRAARHIQFPTNIELVRKYYDKIYVTTIAVYDGDSYSSVARTINE